MDRQARMTKKILQKKKQNFIEASSNKTLDWNIFRIYVSFILFQSYCDVEAEDTQSLKT